MRVAGPAPGSHYRAKQPVLYGPAPKRATPPNALTLAEQEQVLGVLTSERFCDKSVAQTWATLLDEGTYLCSMSTMHRLLRAHGAAGERRRQATHPAKKKPELLDIFSRYVVAWTVQTVEDSGIAKTMLEEAMGVHGIPEAVHADRGTSMTSKPVAQLLLDPRRRPVAFPAQGEQRQPLQRVGVQDPEVRTRLPRGVRFTGRRPGVLRDVLRLLQP